MIQLSILPVLLLFPSNGPAEMPRSGGILDLRLVQDAKGSLAPVPARVYLAGPDGKPVDASGLPFYRNHFSCPGQARLEGLSKGTYTFAVERGPEYRRATGKADVDAKSVTNLEVKLTRWIDMASLGWYSGDTHVHREIADLPLIMRSEDLNVAPVITVWNKRNAWSSQPLPDPLLVEVEPRRVFHALAIEDERGGGALLYFGLTRPLDLAEDGREFPSPVAHLLRARQQAGSWVEVEKPFWWDMPTWVATGQVDSIEIAHNHMQHDGMMPDEAWGRPRDKDLWPPPRGIGYYTQELYYHLLNCGLRIPPSAGSASGVLPNPVGYNRVYVHIDGPFSYEAWWRGLKAGRSFVTNGPILLVQANKQDPGTIFRSERGEDQRLDFSIEVEANDPIEAVEIVRDGRVVERWQPNASSTRVESYPVSFERSGWCLVRAICATPETFRFASTAPFYVEVGNERATIHSESARFFVDWIDERIEALSKPELTELSDPARRDAVLKPHREARLFFEKLARPAQ